MTRALVLRSSARRTPREQLAPHALANVITLIFAVTLCLVNAAVWTLVSDMPLMGLAWGAAAFACVFLQKWTRG